MRCTYPLERLQGVLGHVDVEVSSNGFDFAKGSGDEGVVFVVPDPTH